MGLSRRYMRRVACQAAIFAFASLQTASADTYDTQASFFTAISGLGTVSTQAFDTTPAGTTTFSDGDSIGQITFNNSIGFDLIVATGLVTTSSPNYLGVVGDELFHALDQWGLTFASPVFAVGMYFITADELFAGDIVLRTDTDLTASNSAFADVTLGTDRAYFVGLTSNTSFDSVRVEYGPDVEAIFFTYNVDDITTVATAAVPEPSGMLVLTCAGVVILSMQRKHLRRKS
jgi:hypothetical protein